MSALGLTLIKNPSQPAQPAPQAKTQPQAEATAAVTALRLARYEVRLKQQEVQLQLQARLITELQSDMNTVRSLLASATDDLKKIKAAYANRSN
jgi:hypothetical protein